MIPDERNRSDAELARRAREGSAAAFEILYDRHAPGVARALASFAGPDHDLLDDLVQDVFLRVIRGLPSYAPSHPFAHWLYTIALNVGRNHARRARVVPVNPAELDDLAGVSHGDPGDAVLLMRLVSRLPEPMREVVSLRVGADLSYGDIGELLGIPDGTARSRMHHATRMLRDLAGIAERKRSNDHD
jgi:RNA polymerase sigma-70 factor (ECF subfamily)